MTASPIPDGLRAIAREAAIEAWGPRVGAPGSAYLGKVADAVLAAVYPLLRAQWEAERGAASEWALWAARQALDATADGAEQTA